MKDVIEFKDFQKADIRTCTIIKAESNPGAHNPVNVMDVDFGKFGIKKSSAQLTENYGAEDLTGQQIVAVVNFPPKRITGIKSEVWVLGALSEKRGNCAAGTRSACRKRNADSLNPV